MRFWRLKRARDKLAREAAQQLLGGDESAAEAVAENLKRVATYDAVLASQPAHKLRQISTAALVGMLCLVLIGVGWTKRIPQTDVVLKLQTTSASLRLDRAWTWSGASVALESADHVVLIREIDSLALGRSALDIPESRRLSVSGGEIALTDLSLDASGLLDIEKDEDGLLNLYARGAMFDVAFDLEGEIEFSPELRDCAESCEQVSDSLALRADSAAVPTQLRFKPEEQRALSHLVVDELRFSRVDPLSDEPASFRSSISGGSVLFPDTSSEVEVANGDVVSVEVVNGIVHEIVLADVIEVIFSGAATSVRVGPRGYERELMPSYLRYYFHSDRLSFFVASFGMLWGILWSAQKFILG